MGIFAGRRSGDVAEAAAAEVAAVYREHVSMVRRRAWRILGTEAAAEDITQQVFLRLFERRREGESERDPAAYLYRTTTNLALNALRDGKRRRELEAIRLPPAATTSEPLDDRLSLRRVLALVSEEEAQIASYYFLDGLEHEEIAELCGLQRRTVGRRLESFQRQAQMILQTREVDHAAG
jgi:RNA polymerase sigma-70 factor, ECF subfamily